MHRFLILLLCIHARASSDIAPPKPPFNRGMHERQPSEMVRALPGDEVVVHWNLSPLLAEQFQHKLGDDLGLYHASVGFTNMRTGLNSTVEFAADNFDASLLVPAQNNANQAMTWNNTAKVKPYEGELDTYYWSKRLKVATISGSTYNAMLKWMETAVKTYTRYDFFALESSAGGLKLQGDPRFDGFTCFHFAKAALEQIAKLAGPCVFDRDRAWQGVFVNDVILLQASHGPAQSPATSAEAWPFYEEINKIPDLKSFHYKKVIAELARVARQWNGQKVYHSSTGGYWSYKPREPLYGIREGYAPLPGTCPPKQQIVV